MKLKRQNAKYLQRLVTPNMINLFRQFSKYPEKWKFFQVKRFMAALNEAPAQLTKETLTGRFLLYLSSTKPQEHNKLSQSLKMDLIATLRSQNMNMLDAGQVSTIINCLTDKSLVTDKYQAIELLRLIDEGCCMNIDTFTPEDNLKLLSAFTAVIGSGATRSRYFLLGLEHLTNNSKQLNKDQLIHLVFYIGLMKQNVQAQNMMRKCLMLFTKPLVDILTQEDLCILCNSAFKTSTKIKNRILLEKIKNHINDNLCILNDPAVFVTFVKTLRHNRYQDEDILNSIKCTMFFNKTLYLYPFTCMCHILALYADYLYYDEQILSVFSKRCLELLQTSTFKTKSVYLTEQPRSKDIKRFLWALSNLNYPLSKTDIDKIVLPQIIVRVDSGEFRSDPGSLIQMILYLWMMQYKPYNLIKQFVTPEIVQTIRTQQIACKDSLELLLYCIYYEESHLFQELKIQPEKMARNYNMDVQLAKRPTLRKIIDNLTTIGLEHDMDKFEVGCQIPGINIIGVTGFQKKIYKSVHIEVLDEYTCLKNSDNVPSGLMQLKLRILEKSDEGLIVVSSFLSVC